MVSGEMAEAARKKQQRESRAKRSRANGPVCASLSRVPCRPLEARSVPRAMRRGCDTCGPRQSCTNACAMVRARACGHQRHHRDSMGTRVGMGGTAPQFAWKRHFCWRKCDARSDCKSTLTR